MRSSSDPRETYDAIRQRISELQSGAPIVAVLVADLVDSTAYKSQREPVTSLLKIYRHNSEIEEQVRKHGGQVVKCLGDGVMASFPIEEPDDVNAALDAAIRALKHFHEANERVMDTERIETRVGIALGPVINFAALSPAGEDVEDPHGAAADRAARLCSLAAPGQILCDEHVYGSAQQGAHHYPFSAPALRRLKGFADAVEVRTLNWNPKDPSDVPFMPPSYSPAGFLKPESVLGAIATSRSVARVVGLSNRRYCDNSDLRNIIWEKVEQNSEYQFELVFLHPYSPFKAFAQQITRRRSSDLAPEIIRNLELACELFSPLASNVALVCSHYPMAVPFIRTDDILHFGLPLRSSERTQLRVGVVGGPFFSVHAESDIGRAIVESADADEQVRIDPAGVAQYGGVEAFLTAEERSLDTGDDEAETA